MEKDEKNCINYIREKQLLKDFEEFNKTIPHNLFEDGLIENYIKTHFYIKSLENKEKEK